MATKEELASKLAGELAKLFSDEVYGAEGCPLDADIDEIEDNAVLAAKAAFDAVIARALELQNQELPNQLPCPKCSNSRRGASEWVLWWDPIAWIGRCAS